ncbi:four helix bundle protein [Candidatus Saccharibacteria bacterium]|nr:four helix bundle protein [Candidatus Saccharibacteria bacterium]
MPINALTERERERERSSHSHDLPILQKCTDAYKLWHSFLGDLPRLSRFTLGVKIDSLFTDTIELILLAGYASKPQKAALVAQASTKLDALKFFVQVAWELKVLDNKKYLRVSEPLTEVGKMLGGWRKQLQLPLESTGNQRDLETNRNR